MNKILFTYDKAADSLWLNRESCDVVPVFDPADIMDTLRTLAKSEQPVRSVTQVEVNHKLYSMEAVSDEPQKQLAVTLTKIEE